MRLRVKYSLPVLNEVDAEPGSKPTFLGTVPGYEIEIFPARHSGGYGMYIYSGNDENPVPYRHENAERLKLYAEILYGSVEWRTP